MSSVGGETWGTAGDLPLDDITDVTPLSSVVGASDPYYARWWTFTAPSDGTIAIDCFQSDPSSDPDTILIAYTGSSEGAAVQVDYDDDTSDGAGHNSMSRVGFFVQSGVTYHVKVGTLDSVTRLPGFYVLNTDFTPAGTGVGGETWDQAGELPIGFNSRVLPSMNTAPEVWWKFTPQIGDPNPVVLSVHSINDVDGSEFVSTTTGTLYTGTDLGSATFVPRVNPSSPDRLYALTVGVEYHLVTGPGQRMYVAFTEPSAGDWIQDADITVEAAPGGAHNVQVFSPPITEVDHSGSFTLTDINLDVPTVAGSVDTAIGHNASDYGAGGTSGSVPVITERQVTLHQTTSPVGYQLKGSSQQQTLFCTASPSGWSEPSGLYELETPAPALISGDLKIVADHAPHSTLPHDYSIPATFNLYKYAAEGTGSSTPIAGSEALLSSETLAYNTTTEQFITYLSLVGDDLVAVLFNPYIKMNSGWAFSSDAIGSSDETLAHHIELSIDMTYSNYVWRPPRYRLLTPTPGTDLPPAIAYGYPLRRFPPVNNGGFGPTRHYPRSPNMRVGSSY